MTTQPTMLVSLDDPNWGEINTTRCKILLLEIQRKQLDNEFENRRKQLDDKLNETRQKLNDLTSDQKSASKAPPVRKQLKRPVSQYERPATVAPTVAPTVNSTVEPTITFADMFAAETLTGLNNTASEFSSPFDVPREKLAKN